MCGCLGGGRKPSSCVNKFIRHLSVRGCPYPMLTTACLKILQLSQASLYFFSLQTENATAFIKLNKSQREIQTIFQSTVSTWFYWTRFLIPPPHTCLISHALLNTKSIFCALYNCKSIIIEDSKQENNTNKSIKVIAN